MAVGEASADYAAPSAASPEPYRPEGDAGEREMQDLEDLLSKLNPMAEEFVPPSLAAPPAHAAPYGYYPNLGGGGFAPVASPGHRGVVGFPAADGLGGRGRKGGGGYGGHGHGGKRRMNSRTSMAQHDEVIRRMVYVSDIDHQLPALSVVRQRSSAQLKQDKTGKTSGGSSGKTSGGSSEKTETNESIELNSRNFDELVIKSNDLWIVEFFAPWCGHCKKLAPEWKRVAKNLKGQVKLGHVDCDAEKSLMSKYKIEGFPTILVFGADKESPFPYQGARVASAIESFALEQLEANSAPPEVSELTGPDVMEDKCAAAAICFVSFLSDILDSKAKGRNKYLELLLSVAEKFKKSPYSFVWTAAGKQADLEKQVGVGGYGYPAMVALNVKKGAYAPLRSAFQRDEIIEFVKEAGRGGRGNLPLDGAPAIVQSEPWDGKDGEVIEEDEFSLEELMGDNSPPNDEL